MFMTTDEIERLIREDVPYIDLTCELLGIRDQMAEIRYTTRESGIVAGTEIVAKMFERLGIELIEMKRSGESINAGDIVLVGKGNSEAIHTVWKIGQNIIDYSSGIASTTRKMVNACNAAHPKIALLTTRKNIPGLSIWRFKALLQVVLCHIVWDYPKPFCFLNNIVNFSKMMKLWHRKLLKLSI